MLNDLTKRELMLTQLPNLCIYLVITLPMVIFILVKFIYLKKKLRLAFNND